MRVIFIQNYIRGALLARIRRIVPKRPADIIGRLIPTSPERAQIKES